MMFRIDPAAATDCIIRYNFLDLVTVTMFGIFKITWRYTGFPESRKHEYAMPKKSSTNSVPKSQMQNEMVEFQGLNSSISKKSMCITLGTIPKTKKKGIGWDERPSIDNLCRCHSYSQKRALIAAKIFFMMVGFRVKDDHRKLCECVLR